MTKLRSYALCLARGVKRQGSLGGNPTFIFLVFGFLAVLVKYPIIPLLDVFLCFKLVFVPSKAFGLIWVKVDLILLKNRNLCTHENSFHEPQKCDFELILFAED